MRRNNLILIAANSKLPKQLEGQKFAWIFLSRDYICLMALKKTMPEGSEFIDLGDLLYSTSHQLRRPYINFIGGLSVKRASFLWWISKIAEKNVMDSSIFLNACYLDIISRLASNELKSRNICVFADSPELLETIAQSSLFNGYLVSKIYKTYSPLKGQLKTVLNLIRFVKRCVLEKVAAALTRTNDNAVFNNEMPLIVLRTWVGENALGENGVFKDSYFTGLYERLKLLNKNVAVIPIIYNIKRSFKETIRWFRESSTRFIIPVDYYYFGDYLRTIFIILKSARPFKEDFKFNDWDLKLIVRRELYKSLFAGSYPQLIMHYFLIKRLKQRGVKVERFIITFENMMPEKPFILGREKFYPEAKLLGFQHPSIFPLLLSWYTSAEEIKVLPLPDKIICSGKLFKEILLREGYPEEKLIAGPALRFQYLLRSSREPSAQPIDGPAIVLVTLPLERSLALELLLKAFAAAKNIPDLKILIKPHPMMSPGELQAVLDAAADPSLAFEISENNINDLMARSRLLITTASAVILEAVAFGLPVIRVRCDLDLTLDPMDWLPFDEQQFIARRPIEIEVLINKILVFNYEQLQQIRSQGRQLITRCFSPLTEQTLAPFYE